MKCERTNSGLAISRMIQGVKTVEECRLLIRQLEAQAKRLEDAEHRSTMIHWDHDYNPSGGQQ